MAKIIESQMQVFVTYKLNPVPETFEDSLYKHLLSEVWGDSRWVDEDIRVCTDLVNGKRMINAVLYQFGERYDEDLAEEIGELIDEQISRWAAKTSALDLLDD